MQGLLLNMETNDLSKSEAEFTVTVLGEQKYRIEKHLETCGPCSNILFMLEKNEVKKIDNIIEKLCKKYGIKRKF